MTYNAGGSLTGTLTVVFVVLKLTKVIEWSWVWVLSPIWINLSIAAVFLGFIFLMAILTKGKITVRRNK